MAEGERAPVTPAVLAWARQQAGYSIEDVAARLKVKPERVQRWEDGSAGVTFGRLDALAALFRRPTSIFYLPQPPHENYAQPKDFRSHSGSREGSPGFRYQVRLAHERRAIALELLDQLREEAPRFNFRVDRDDSTESAGARLRKHLSLPPPSDESWRKTSSAYNRWRDAVEQHGVLVFQAPFKDLEGMRGFSIYQRELSVVVIGTEESQAGRLFTLAHELVHLGLREGGICDFEDAGVEGFCNQVAAAALMPESALRSAATKGQQWPASATAKLARELGVSEEALVLRLVHLKLAPRSLYSSRRADFEPRKQSRDPDAKSGGPPPHMVALARNGTRYSQLVVTALAAGRISLRSAAVYLGVGPSHVDKVADDVSARVWKREGAA